MQQITNITKRYIHKLFKYGIDVFGIQIEYPYYGCLDECDFLKRQYNLEEKPSLDDRYSNAEQDIWQHTVINDDYEPCWIFEDERFPLKNGQDEELLAFLCEVFHPEVRDEDAHWRDFLIRINDQIRCDGHELFPAEKISGREIYHWRLYTPDAIFEPFSIRNSVKRENNNLSICRDARYQIYQAIESNSRVEIETSETGFSYSISIRQKLLSELKKFYVLQYCDKNGNNCDTEDLQTFIQGTSPECVFDAIELFSRMINENAFDDRINTIFRRYLPVYRLHNNKIDKNLAHQIVEFPNVQVPEAHLQKLLQEAMACYDEEKLEIAVEKLWDGFERLKTVFGGDKKRSTEKLVRRISGDNETLKIFFDREFKELTEIGNCFTIRHHEIGQTEIKDKRHYEYFFKKCMAMISLALQYI